MRDPKRIDRILALLADRWKAAPDLRLGQLIRNLVNPEDLSRLSLIEDDKMEELLRDWEPKWIPAKGTDEPSRLLTRDAFRRKAEELREKREREFGTVVDKPDRSD